jgi:hypothetical protein
MKEHYLLVLIVLRYSLFYTQNLFSIIQLNINILTSGFNTPPLQIDIKTSDFIKDYNSITRYKLKL